MKANCTEPKWMTKLSTTVLSHLSIENKCSPQSEHSTSSGIDAPEILISTLVPKSSDEIVNELDPRFFTEYFDPVAYIMENLPDTREELAVFLQTEISAVDLAKDVIVTKLAEDVRSNLDTFIQGMKLAQDVDLEIVRAQIHVKNGRRLLASAQNDLVISALEVIKTKHNRDRVSVIIEMCSQVTQYFEEEQSMNKALKTDNFVDAVDICLDLRQSLATNEIGKLSILGKIEKRINNFLPELRQQFDHSLRKFAEKFDPIRYKKLIEAYIKLWEHADNLNLELEAGNHNETPWLKTSLSDVLLNIPEVVVRSIKEIGQLYLQDAFILSLDAKKKSKNQEGSTNNRTTTQIIQSLLGSFEKFTDLMHNYYLFVQWHRDPFNPLNDDLTYLHRCGIDEDDDDDEEEDEEDNEGDDDHDSGSDVGKTLTEISKSRKQSLSKRRSSTSISSESEKGQLRSSHTQVLCDTGMTLLRYRKIVWEHMQHSIMDLLDRMDVSFGFKLEHIILLSQATIRFIEVGEEFTGAPSNKLRSIVRMKCEQYVENFHEDNMELMRMLMDTENWQRIETPHELSVSFLRLMESRSGYTFNLSHAGISSSSAIHSRRTLPSYLVNGNPFGNSSSSNWQITKRLLRFQIRDTHQLDIIEKYDGNTVVVPEIESCDEFDLKENLVVNSSTLSGFVRLSGVYLKLMEHLPLVSWEVFQRLNKLFQFNFYAVFLSFSETSQMARLFSEGYLDFTQKNRRGRFDHLYQYVREIASSLGVNTSLQLSAQTFCSVSTYKNTRANDSIGQLKYQRVIRLPSIVDNTRELNLYGLSERSTACEGILFQMKLLDAVEPLLRAFLPERFHCLLDEAINRSREATKQLRLFVYTSIAGRLIEAHAIPEMISQVNWNMTYLSDRHNDYVVNIVRKCGEVWGALQILGDGSIPLDIREEIWRAILSTVIEAVLLGFSEVKNCTLQGRSVMSMDLHALVNGLELIHHVSGTFSSARAYINNYIKAFFLGNDDLVDWVSQHKNNYDRHLIFNLVKNGIGSSLSKKDLKELALRVETELQS